MGERLFWTSFALIFVLTLPIFAFGMLIVLVEVNWHDILLVSAVVAGQVQIIWVRRTGHKINRIARWAERRRLLRDETPYGHSDAA